MNRWISALLMVSVVFSAKAEEAPVARGGQEGNGGDVVVCFANPAVKQEVERILIANRKKIYKDDPFTENVLNQIESVRMYDLMLSKEAGVDQKEPVIESEGNSRQIVEERLALLQRKSRYHDELRANQKVLSDINWIGASNGVIEIDDSQTKVNFGDRCILVQIAVQHGSQVFFDERLRRKMRETAGEVHDAALFLHEYAYRSAPDSRAVQKAIGILFMKRFEQMSGEEFNFHLASVGLKPGSHSEMVNAAGRDLLIWAQESDLDQFSYKTADPLAWEIRNVGMISAHHVKLSDPTPNAEVQWAVAAGAQKLGSVLIPDQATFYNDSEGRPDALRTTGVFYPYPELACRGGQVTQDYKLTGESFPVRPGDYSNNVASRTDDLRFYPSGRVKSCLLAYDQEIEGTKYLGGTWIKFEDTEELRVISGVRKAFPGLAFIQGVPCRHSGDVSYHRSGNLSKCALGQPYVDREATFILNPDNPQFTLFLDHPSAPVLEGWVTGESVIDGVPCGELIKRFESGRLKQCDPRKAFVLDGKSFAAPHRTDHYHPSLVLYDQDSNRVSNGILWPEQEVAPGVWMVGKAAFYPSGRIQAGTLARDLYAGRKRIEKKGKHLEFNEDGTRK